MTSPSESNKAASALNIRFFRSDWHGCSYLDGRAARTLFVDPRLPKDNHLYSLLQESGFRRSGSEIYRPDCGPCKDCIPARLPTGRFSPRRRHRRLLKAGNEMFRLSWDGARFTDEYFALYRRYIDSRHGDGDMANPGAEDFSRFLIGSWSDTMFLRVHHDDRLVAVAVTDFTATGLSAVYTFFDPDYERFSPGAFCLLNQITEARELGLPWLYLGFWVPNCRKMSYKIDYRPIQLLIGGEWREFDVNATPPRCGTDFD